MGKRKTISQAEQAPRLILDSGAVIGLSKGDPRARGFLAAAIKSGAVVSVPTVVVAETARTGPRGTGANRVLAEIDRVDVLDELTARQAGTLLGVTKSSKTIDAIVVATAAAVGGMILTGDAADLTRLARGTGDVVIHSL